MHLLSVILAREGLYSGGLVEVQTLARKNVLYLLPTFEPYNSPSLEHDSFEESQSQQESLNLVQAQPC